MASDAPGTQSGTADVLDLSYALNNATAPLAKAALPRKQTVLVASFLPERTWRDVFEMDAPGYDGSW